jgi:crotonobetainyl-CoA:carnitine CoA-transferase CaiB-like acyl-CoA transferase
LLNPYRTADNRWLLLVAAQRKDWASFAKAIDKPELLEDARFSDENRATNAAALVGVLDPIFASQPPLLLEGGLERRPRDLRGGADRTRDHRRSAACGQRHRGPA